MGAKIYVIKLKQIIKVLVSLTVAALILLFAAALIKNGSKPTYKPGIYTSSIILHNAPVSVEVEVSRHSIESVNITDLSETQAVFYPLFSTSAKEIADRIVAEQTCDIPIDSSYSVTGGIITDAVKQALSQAEE